MNELFERAACGRPKRQCVSLHRREMILIPNYPFWSLDSGPIRRIAGDK
jgi:hypothetical protein